MITVCENEATPESAPTLARGLNPLLDLTERGLAVKATRACSIDGCDRPVHVLARALCNPHYLRLLRSGDPLGSGRPIVSRGGPLTYVGAHTRVRRARGSAAAYTCGCGAPAKEWAYDHADPNELVKVKGHGRNGAPIHYSADPAHYRPLCKPCHARFDANPEAAS